MVIERADRNLETGGQRIDRDRLLEECTPAARRIAMAVLQSPPDAEQVAREACRTVLAKLESGATVDDPEMYVARTAWRLARAQSQAAARRGRAEREAPPRWSGARPYLE
jgi:DNA-directed RNA polymerase specialized sigma24 family protein